MVDSPPGGETAEGAGAAFGKYRIVRLLGQGAFGAVYEALLPGPMGFSKRVAIKRLHPELTKQKSFVHSMVNEARIGGLLNDANIVGILEFDQVDGSWYMAMEFVDGVDLAELINICSNRRVLLPRFAVVDLVVQVCKGLQYAHELRDEHGRPLGLVHRDLKPSNIIVNRRGTAKLCDFGIAKAASNRFQTTATGMTKGTPSYMAPEQLAGARDLGPRADLWSLGAVVYQLLTGRLLFRADNLVALVAQITQSDLSGRLAQAEAAFPGVQPILERALQRDPELRYQSARELADDFRALGRAWPPQAGMAEVIGRLMPALDRTDSREILDSADLELAADVEAPIDPTLEADPIPPPAPADSGWELFTEAFDTPRELESSGLTPPAEPEAEPPAGPVPPTRLEPGPARDVPPTRLVPAERPGRRGRRLAFGFALGLPLALLLVLWLRGEPEPAPVEQPTAPAVTSTPAAVAPVTPPISTPAAAPTPTPTATQSPSTRPQATPAPTPEEVSLPLEPGTLKVRIKPWGTIFVDGQELVSGGSALAPRPVDAGAHRVRAVCGAPACAELPEAARTKDWGAVEVGAGEEQYLCWDFVAGESCR